MSSVEKCTNKQTKISHANYRIKQLVLFILIALLLLSYYIQKYTFTDFISKKRYVNYM